MTRLGEISPLWQNFKVFGQLLKALFTIWQNFEPILAIFYAIGQIYIPINGQILKIVWPSGHTASIILLRSTLSLNIFNITYVSVKVLRISSYRDAEVFSYE